MLHSIDVTRVTSCVQSVRQDVAPHLVTGGLGALLAVQAVAVRAALDVVHVHPQPALPPALHTPWLVRREVLGPA